MIIKFDLKSRKMSFVTKYIRVDTIVDTLKPFVFALQISGMYFYSISNVNGVYVQSKMPSPFYLIEFLIVFSVYFVSVFISLSGGYTLVEIIYISDFLEMNDSLKNILGLILVLCVNFLVVTTKQLYTHKFNLLVSIQKWFAQIGVVINYTKLFLENLLMALFHHIVHIFHTLGAVYLASAWTKKSQMSTIVTGSVPTFISTIFLLLYIGIIKTTSRNLSELKKQMNNLKVSAWNTIYVRNGSDLQVITPVARNKIVARKLRVLSKIYDKICDLTDSMNEGFGPHCLIICTFAFTVIVINLFFALHSFFEIVYNNYYSRKTVYFFYFSLHQCLVHVINIVMLSKTCTDCQTKGKKIAVIVTKMMLVETDKEVVKMLRYFTSLTVQRTPVFSACGLYNLNNTMIFKMVGAATTYLVILAQFQMNRSFHSQTNSTMENAFNNNSESGY